MEQETTLSVGTNGHYLKADVAASDIAWASIPAGVGGANGVDFNDDVKARFGTRKRFRKYFTMELIVSLKMQELAHLK